MTIGRPHARSFIARVAVALAVGIAASACSRADDASPVATVSFAASRTRVPLGSPVELTYTFDVAPGASIASDYAVFMQVVADGQLLWSDDHEPVIPTSKWQGGQKVEYTRTRFVPIVPYLGPATVHVGLYRENERLPLAGGDPADQQSASRSYKVATLELLPTSENVFVIYKSGWHPMEFPENDPTVSWQWTQKSAVLAFRNPRSDVTLYLDYDARPDLFAGTPQQVTVSSSGQVVGQFTATATSQTVHRFPVNAAQLGSADMSELTIEVDKTFIPAKLPSGGKDTRELGIRVYHAFVERR